MRWHSVTLTFPKEPRQLLCGNILFQIAVVCLAYAIAGKLGQATTNIRSSNLGPV
jgi:hypothetical protein